MTPEELKTWRAMIIAELTKDIVYQHLGHDNKWHDAKVKDVAYQLFKAQPMQKEYPVFRVKPVKATYWIGWVDDEVYYTAKTLEERDILVGRIHEVDPRQRIEWQLVTKEVV